ncbi:hypothetical protein BsWGS_07660 [Bradybaena similaris]
MASTQIMILFLTVLPYSQSAIIGRHAYGPRMSPLIPNPIVPVRSFNSPFFRKGKISQPRRFVNRHVTDLAQPFGFMSYQTPFGGPTIIESSQGYSTRVKDTFSDTLLGGPTIVENSQGFPTLVKDTLSDTASSTSFAAPGDYDIFSRGSGGAAAAMANDGGLGGGAAAATPIARGTAAATSLAGGAAGLDALSGPVRGKDTRTGTDIVYETRISYDGSAASVPASAAASSGGVGASSSAAAASAAGSSDVVTGSQGPVKWA